MIKLTFNSLDQYEQLRELLLYFSNDIACAFSPLQQLSESNVIYWTPKSELLPLLISTMNAYLDNSEVQIMPSCRVGIIETNNGWGITYKKSDELQQFVQGFEYHYNMANNTHCVATPDLDALLFVAKCKFPDLSVSWIHQP